MAAAATRSPRCLGGAHLLPDQTCHRVCNNQRPHFLCFQVHGTERGDAVSRNVVLRFGLKKHVTVGSALPSHLHMWSSRCLSPLRCLLSLRTVRMMHPDFSAQFCTLSSSFHPLAHLKTASPLVASRPTALGGPCTSAPCPPSADPASPRERPIRVDCPATSDAHPSPYKLGQSAETRLAELRLRLAEDAEERLQVERQEREVDGWTWSKVTGISRIGR